MQESRTKNSLRNITWGVIYKIITLLLPFLTRTITLYLLGANYLGIDTLFSSVLSFLSLTELGLGSAIVYIMYSPIVDGNIELLGSILNYYKKLYRKIGVVMLVIGTIVVPVIPFLINNGTPDGINVYILYYLYLINSVISYFFSGYRSSLLSAYQREDVNAKLLTIVSIVVQFGQIFVLYTTKNYYLFAIVPIVGTLITNTMYLVMTKKMYPDVNPTGKVDTSIKQDVKKRIGGLVGTKLNSIVVHSADNIIISAFLGLTVTAQYGNYYLIFNAVCGFVAVFFSAITASIGNKLVMDTIDNNFILFKNLSFLNMWIVCICCTCFLCLFEPFMEIWVGKELVLGLPFTILMVLYFFVYQIQKTVLTFKDAAGLWHIDKLRPYVSMIVNLVSNLVLVQFIGIYGIVISTIIAFLISLPWANKVLFDILFKKNHFLNLFVFAKDLLITILISGSTYVFCMVCRSGILGIVERLIICLVIPNLVLTLLYYKRPEFNYWKHVAKKMIRRR